MKKIYLIPSINGLQMGTENMLAASGVTSSNNDVNIGYGGIDTDGDLEADAKSLSIYDVWDDDWSN